MVLYHLRYELCVSNGLPLVYLPTPFQLSIPHMVLKRDFWSVTTVKDQSRRLYWFGAGVLVATILTALVGPSSAILILPQLKWWAVKHPFSGTDGFTYLGGTHDVLWPGFVDQSLVPEDCLGDSVAIRIPQHCPYANVVEISRWAQDALSQNAPPNITATTDANMLRYLTSSHNATSGYSVASTGMSDLSRDLGTIWLYGQRHNLSFAKLGRPMLTLSSRDAGNPIMRPLVQVECGMPHNVQEDDSITLSFPSDNLRMGKDKAQVGQSMTQVVNTTLFANGGFPKVSYIDLSAEAGRPTLGALVGMTFTNPQLLFDPSSNDFYDRGLIPCTIASHWIPTTMARDPITDNVVMLDNPDPMGAVTSTALMQKARNISIDLSYAEVVNRDLGGITVLEFELQYLSYAQIQLDGNLSIPGYDGGWNEKWPWLVSTLLSLQLSDALARLNHDVSMLVYCKDCNDHPFNISQTSYAQNIADLNNFYSIHVMPNDSAVSLPQNITKHPELYTPVQWRIEHFGYAWGFDRVTKILAATVIILHLVLLVAHLFIVVCVRQWRCDSWDNLVELLVLAMQSPPTAILRGTSTGIDDASTYADSVLIRESDDLGISGNGEQRAAVMVITDPADRYQHQFRKLETNKKYL